MKITTLLFAAALLAVGACKPRSAGTSATSANEPATVADDGASTFVVDSANVAFASVKIASYYPESTPIPLAFKFASGDILAFLEVKTTDEDSWLHHSNAWYFGSAKKLQLDSANQGCRTDSSRVGGIVCLVYDKSTGASSQVVVLSFELKNNQIANAKVFAAVATYDSAKQNYVFSNVRNQKNVQPLTGAERPALIADVTNHKVLLASQTYHRFPNFVGKSATGELGVLEKIYPWPPKKSPLPLKFRLISGGKSEYWRLVEQEGLAFGRNATTNYKTEKGEIVRHVVTQGSSATVEVISSEAAVRLKFSSIAGDAATGVDGVAAAGRAALQKLGIDVARYSGDLMETSPVAQAFLSK